MIFCVTVSCMAQKYWQQQLHYTIDVSLNDADHSLTGFIQIDYLNNSPDTLSFIWFHLYPNAYKNDQTAFSDQQLENGSTEFYFSKEKDRGYINQLNFEVNGITAITEEQQIYIDVIKVYLPEPLAPNALAKITTPFHVQLPYHFSRSGHDGQTYQVTQWFPKPAVYDALGWHPMPYLDQGEFYGEFGNWEVKITLPENYIVAASGKGTNEEEEKKMQLIAVQPLTKQNNYKWFEKQEKVNVENLTVFNATLLFKNKNTYLYTSTGA